MAGSALSLFGDLVLTTGPAIYSSAEKVVNELAKNTYLLKRFLKGVDPSEVLQGGSTIKDQIFLDMTSTYEQVLPNEDSNFTNPQVLTEWEINWRYGQDHMSWTDQQIELNEGLTKPARHQQYKRHKRTIEQRMWTSMLNGMEDELFATPNANTMEAAGGRAPYSLPCFINEETNGLFGSVTTATPGGTWTTIEGIAPATYTRWKCQQEAYTNFDANDAANVFAAFDSMFWDVHFEAPGTKEEYFENPRLYRQFIACSKAGITKYQQLLRASNDRLVLFSEQDPAYMRPSYAGIDLVYVANLDTASLYSKSGATTTTGTEAQGDESLPRYYWINATYMRPCYHSRFYMRPIREIIPERQVNAHIVPVQCWHNYPCQSLQRQGMVYPVTA